MAISWNEIRERALAFSREWANESREKAEAKTFWDDFFQVFGISRRRVATFEEPVKKLGNEYGFIDLFWKGVLLVEHKSSGKNLDKAYSQALDYFAGLKEHELPKYVIVSDFQHIRLYDLDENNQHDFSLKNLHQNIQLFGFIAGYQKHTLKDEDPVNIKAAELMGKLHDALKASGYTGHKLEVYLVRLLFCLFADDTTIFEQGSFRQFIEDKTRPDGSDLGTTLAQLFQVLNTPTEKQQTTLDEHLADFTYINGNLFAEPLPIAAFNTTMRETFLECCGLNWSKISPAIFGSMFQSVMDVEQRRNLGAHYTSEKNILKLIKPLFLDDLRTEFEKCKSSVKKLQIFHKKIAGLTFLDPACGCGNFLVITYRELRLLELDILRILYKKKKIKFLNIKDIVLVNIERYYGIECEEWPARIAEVAMWLVDHQMNMQISEEFGQYFVRLPLEKSANIITDNALRIDWKTITASNKHKLDYILGNPPFIGKKRRNDDQKQDMNNIMGKIKGANVLDYVTAWYIKAAEYIQKTNIKVAFVSTNSISQGEQVGILWNELFNKYQIKIHFAHQTFKWKNEARGNAVVHVAIIGFANFDINKKRIFEYENINGEPHETSTSNINPYLVKGKDAVLEKRRKPICKVPPISFGSMPNDGGHLLFTDQEKKDFIAKEPGAKRFFKPLLSAKEFLHGTKRWCLWLVHIPPSVLRSLPMVKDRISKVQQMRKNSNRPTTKVLADFPALFGEIRQPKNKYILIPLHSSGNRKYIPLGFFSPSNIAHNSCATIPKATLYHFGIMSSEMHVSWVRYVCGRLGSSFRYSNELVYNNFPWPEKPSKTRIAAVEKAAQNVLDARDEFSKSSLADIYDPLAMPSKLTKAHKKLDRAVDLCYRSQKFPSAGRIEFLFDLYTHYTQTLLKQNIKKTKIKRRN